MRVKRLVMVLAMLGVISAGACTKPYKEVEATIEPREVIEEEIESEPVKSEEEKLEESLGISFEELTEGLSELNVTYAGNTWSEPLVGYENQDTYYVPMMFNDYNTITSLLKVSDPVLVLNDTEYPVKYEVSYDTHIAKFDGPADLSLENLELQLNVRNEYKDYLGVSYRYGIGASEKFYTEAEEGSSFPVNTLVRVSDDLYIDLMSTIEQRYLTEKNQNFEVLVARFIVNGYGKDFKAVDVSDNNRIRIRNSETDEILNLPRWSSDIEAEEGTIYFKGEYVGDKEIRFSFYTLESEKESGENAETELDVESVEQAKSSLIGFLDDKEAEIRIDGKDFRVRFIGEDA